MKPYSVDLKKKDLEKRQGFISGEAKKDLCAAINAGTYTTNEVAEKCSVTANTVRKWLRNYAQGIVMHDGPGQPQCISTEQLEKIAADAEIVPFDYTREEMLVKLCEARKSTDLANNKQFKYRFNVCRKTALKLMKKAGLREGNAEIATTARAIATSDVYNFVSFAAMNKYMVETKKINEFLILNADGTQFEVGGRADHKVKVCRSIRKVRTGKGMKACQKKVKKGDNEGIVKYYIKYYLIISAGGVQADPIFILADENMAEDEMRVVKVPGLGVGTNLDNQGYVVFCKTRSANEKFYSWMMEFVLIPFINQIKKHYELDENEESWFQLDGEDVQLKPFESPRIMGLLKNSKIHVGKPPGSTTAVTQPCDRGNCFKGPKVTNRKINNKDVRNNTFMLRKLKELFDEHNKWLNSEERGDLRLLGKKKKKPTKCDKPGTIEFNPGHKGFAKFGLLRVQLALQYCMRPHMIRESFEQCGIVPFNPRLIMSNCRSSIAPTDQGKILNSVAHLVDLFHNNGELFESDLDLLEISSNVDRGGKKPLDQAVLNRRRACILTHPALIAREKKLASPELPAEEPTEKPAETRITLKRKAKEPSAIAKKLKLII